MGSTGAYVTYRDDIVAAWNQQDSDNDDFVTKEELASIMAALGDEDISEEELDSIYTGAGPRADGKIGFAPFIKAYCDSATPVAKEGEKKFFGLF